MYYSVTSRILTIWTRRKMSQWLITNCQTRRLWNAWNIASFLHTISKTESDFLSCNLQLSVMSFNLVSDEKASQAAEEYAEQLHEIYKHECYGTQKKECKIIFVHFIKPSPRSWKWLNTKTRDLSVCIALFMFSFFCFFLACHTLAEFYMSVERNITKAKELYHYTCYELDLPESCFALGNLYLTQKSRVTSINYYTV